MKGSGPKFAQAWEIKGASLKTVSHGKKCVRAGGNFLLPVILIAVFTSTSKKGE